MNVVVLSRQTAKLAAGIAIAGVLANFVIFSGADSEDAGFGSGWRPVQSGASMTTAVDKAGLGRILGVAGNALPSTTAAQSSVGSESTLSFVYDGVTYRLTGLVVSGDNSAATLIAEGSKPVRVTVGGTLPGGEVIKTITLNEIVLVDTDDQTQRVRIYE